MDESIARASKKVNESGKSTTKMESLILFWMHLFIEYDIHFNTLHMNAHQLSSTAHITFGFFLCLVYSLWKIDIVVVFFFIIRILFCRCEKKKTDITVYRCCL